VTARAAWATVAGIVAFAAPLRAQTYLLVITGLGGEPAYEQRFRDMATTLVETAQARWELAAENTFWLAGSAEGDPAPTGRSTKEGIESLLTRIATEASPAARLIIVLIGHGSGQGSASRINLPGPDMTAADFNALLDRFATQQIVVINLASASGDWVETLSGERRTIVTATKSGHERNQPEFPEYFVNALTGDGADTDKDSRVSVLEAFRYATTEVARSYDRAGRLVTEHALLDDDGDGTGSTEPDLTTGDGAVAANLFFADARDAPAPETADSVLAALYRQRGALEARVATLRTRRAQMDSTAYSDALEILLLDLARTNRSIREREGGSR
jgi:hypothetical protein